MSFVDTTSTVRLNTGAEMPLVGMPFLPTQRRANKSIAMGGGAGVGGADRFAAREWLSTALKVAHL